MQPTLVHNFFNLASTYSRSGIEFCVVNSNQKFRNQFEGNLIFLTQRINPLNGIIIVFCVFKLIPRKSFISHFIIDILRVLVNDYDEHEKEIIAAKNYVDKIYAQTYGKP